MPEMALVSAVYPQAESRCKQFADSVAKACAQSGKCVVLLVAEADYDPKVARERISSVADLRVIETKLRHNPPALRARSVSAGMEADCSVVAFLDYDDIAEADMLTKYMHAFSDKETDVAYGDLGLLDAEGASLGRLMFGEHLPSFMNSQADLHDGNMLGFSNTALRSALLNVADAQPPSAIVAYDWWLFTRLLARRAKGLCVAGPVAGYRLHESNTLGDEADPSPADLLRRMKALAAHYAAFEAEDWAASRLSVVEAAIALLAADQPIPAQAMRSFCNNGGPWFTRLLAGARRMAGEA